RQCCVVRAGPLVLVRMRRPPSSPLFPYTTLFRSQQAAVRSPCRRGRSGPALVAGIGARGARLADRALARQGVVGTPDQLLVHELDRKSTRLNSSHVKISYAVFCLKKKKQTTTSTS